MDLHGDLSAARRGRDRRFSNAFVGRTAHPQATDVVDEDDAGIDRWTVRRQENAADEHIVSAWLADESGSESIMIAIEP